MGTEPKGFIEATNLSKVYVTPVPVSGLIKKLKAFVQPQTEETLAVNALDLKIRRGEFVGLIGENGSGKSTTIKMLTGILKPSAGEVSVCGFVPFRDRRKYVGSITAIMGHKSQLWWDVPVRDSFDALKAIYRIPTESYMSNLRHFTDALDIGSLLEKPPRTLSLGQRVRCDFAAGLLHDPTIAFLDEPTIGLDIKVKELVRTFLSDLNRRRETTIVLTSHDLDDIEQLCERIVILDKGEKLYDEPLTEFLRTLGGARKVDFETSDSVKALDGRLGRLLRHGDDKYSLIFDQGRNDLNEIYRHLAEFKLRGGVNVNDVDIKTVLRHIVFKK